jgi:hypothetical protein
LFKVASVVQGCFSGSRLLQRFKVASSLQGHVGGSRWLHFGSFQGYLFRFKMYSIRFKVASTVQGHVGGWFGSFGFIWFKVASLRILMSVWFKADNYFSFGWELYFGASVTSEGSLEFYGYGFSNLLQLGDCKSPAFHRVWPPQEVIHETTPITSREPMRG